MSSDDTQKNSRDNPDEMAGRPLTTDKPLAARIKEARKAARMTQMDVAKAMKPTVSDNAVAQWEKEGKIKRDNLNQLPGILGVRAEWLYEGKGEMHPRESGSEAQPKDALQSANGLHNHRLDPALRAASNSHLTGSRDLPIWGQGAAGDGRGLNNDGQPVGWTLRPPELVGVMDGYAIYYRGDSLYPVRKNSQIGCFHPGIPPSKEDIVAVQLIPTNSDEGYEELVKAFVKMDAKVLVLEQFNPPKRIEIPAERVKAIHVEVANYRRA